VIQKTQKELVKKLFRQGKSKRFLALEFKVSRRTIDFILDPTKRVENNNLIRSKNGWKLN